MHLRHCVVICCMSIVLARAGHAQAPDSTSRPGWLTALILPGSIGDEQRRTRQLMWGDSTHATLIRSTSTLSASWPAKPRAQVVALLPVLEHTYNSRIPHSLNDGAVWAGRGNAFRMSGGVAAAHGPLHIVIAPELSYTANRPTGTVQAADGNRSPYSSPWFAGPHSADLPLRFGTEPLRMLTAGSSLIELRSNTVSVGATAEDQWWGPGIRNALVLSNNAPGIPHLFLRTVRPVETRLGSIEGRWMAGVLTESIYFDADASNDLRSLSAFAATLRLAAEPGLTLGIARAVYAPASGAAAALGRFPDAFLRWDQSDAAPADADEPSEQLLSLFGRWVLPLDGAEVYGEYARHRPPRSLRDVLVAPQVSQGFTVGMQAARPVASGTLRGAIELTNLEQTRAAPGDTVESFYVSRHVPQGYTQRGQSIGAAIGPGSSSQSLMIDYLARRWFAGAGVERIRWQEDAYPLQFTGVSRLSHDVSLIARLRGGIELPGVRMGAEVLRAQRLNYLFQNRFDGRFPDRTFDVHNTTLRLSAGWIP